MKIELDKSTEDFVYNEERLKPFQEHVLKYFCRNNKECYDYFMNYFARKVQMPGRKNGVAIVLKSKDQGCGKGLNKITLKSHMDLILTSNNDHCVYIDIGDRRYFILNVDDSNANDQSYYVPFRKYCEDPETAYNVYKYLMSIDLSQFNPQQIPETEEKQM